MLWFHSIHVLYHHHVHVLNLLWYCWMYKQTTQSKDLPCPWLDYCRWVLNCLLDWHDFIAYEYDTYLCVVSKYPCSVSIQRLYVVLHRCNYHLYYQKTFWSFTISWPIIVAAFQFNFVIHINPCIHYAAFLPLNLVLLRFQSLNDFWEEDIIRFVVPSHPPIADRHVVEVRRSNSQWAYHEYEEWV